VAFIARTAAVHRHARYNGQAKWPDTAAGSGRSRLPPAGFDGSLITDSWQRIEGVLIMLRLRDILSEDFPVSS
jgi:hypothetical protein